MGLKERAKILEAQHYVGYAYWQVLMRDGRIISEWDMNWIQLPKGIVSARLVCPNGQVPTLELGSGRPIDDRLFHFNIAQAIAGVGRATIAYVIGMVKDPSGNALVYAWEPFENAGRGRLVGPFDDTYPNMTYGGPSTYLIDENTMGTTVGKN